MNEFISVAAHDTEDIDKRESDFVCDGHNDQEEIISAIDLAYVNSAIVMLRAGTYNIEEEVEL